MLRAAQEHEGARVLRHAEQAQHVSGRLPARDREDPGNPLKGEGRKQLTARAKDFESQRERASKQDPNFDFSEALFQIAIVLASVAILADSRHILRLSLVVGLAATLLMINGYFLLLPNLF